ncbi:hypothetical protein GCM10027447_12180 [Glycomyces halotolerans]
MANVPPGRRACLYARVSKDTRKHQANRGRSVKQQVQRGTAAGEELAVASLEIYRDNDVSASAFSTKARDEWDRMMADLAAGRFDLVMLWEASRGSRTSAEGVAFVDLCAAQSALVYIIDEDTAYNPRKPRDRKRLLEMIIDAEYESGQTSERINRDKLALLESGRPDGKIPFGHRRLYDDRTRELIRQEPDPVTRGCIREGVQRINQGWSLRRVRLDFNRRAALDPDDPQWVPLMESGAPWRNDNLRRVLLNPAHIGMRKHPTTGELLEAGWAPLFGDAAWIDEWWSCHRVLTNEDRRASRAAQADHLVSYFMTCDVCGRRQGAGRPPGGTTRNIRYSCRDDPRVDPVPEMGPGCTSIRVSWVDDYISDLVIARVSQPDVIARIGAADDSEAAAAQAEVKRLQAKLDEAFRGYDLDILTLEQLGKRKAKLEPQLEAAKQAAATAGAPPVLREFLKLTAGAGEAVVRRVWENDVPIEAKREVVQLLFEYIKLRRNRPGVRAFEERRIDYKWREW